MRDAFFFTITNPKKYYYTLIANIILLVSFVSYSIIKYFLYKSGECNSIFNCIIFPNTIFIIFFVRLFYVITKRKLEFTNLHFAIIASIGWLNIHYWVIAIIIFLLGVIEYVINKDANCTINKNGVIINSFPTRKYAWQNIENLMIKEGIFTIDQKNNKLFQIDVSEEVIPFQEEDLNNFATSCSIK